MALSEWDEALTIQQELESVFAQDNGADKIREVNEVVAEIQAFTEAQQQRAQDLIRGARGRGLLCRLDAHVADVQLQARLCWPRRSPRSGQCRQSRSKRSCGGWTAAGWSWSSESPSVRTRRSA